MANERISKKDLVKKLSTGQAVEEALIQVNAEKTEAAKFTEYELERIEKKVAESMHDNLLEIIEKELIQGNRIELKDILQLRPFQSGYKLKDGIFGGENTSRQKNKVRVVLRKGFEEVINQKNFNDVK